MIYFQNCSEEIQMSQERSIQDLIKTKIDEWRKQESTGRNYRLRLDNDHKLLPVITVETKLLTLNHNNHRLTAQLKDHPQQEIVFQEPTSLESQKILSELLAETEEFEKLKEELKTLKQEEPGLITQDGLLINGNTRCVALRKLKDEGVALGTFIDIAVLPESITEESIKDIEVNLQMVQTTHQDYTFVNELLFMDDLRRAGKTDNEIAHAMNWIRRGPQKVKQRFRVLNMIEEVRGLTSPPIRYDTFSNKETHLFDLDKDMQLQAGEGDYEGAEELKYQRLLGVLAHLNKDMVREIDCDFLESKIEAKLDDQNSPLTNFLGRFKIQNEPSDDTFGGGGQENTIDSRLLLIAYLSESGVVDQNGRVTTDPDGDFGLLKEEMVTQSDRLIQKGRQENRNEELSLTMRSIRINISDIKEKLGDRMRESGFRAGDFKYELNKAQTELQDLQISYERFKNNS